MPKIFDKLSSYYADGQRIALKDDGVVSYLYGDQLVSKMLYEPWCTTRDEEGSDSTDYAYTGQMIEADIYFYNARWYDPQIGRIMQADSIVLLTQGIQAFDRYAYVNNNPDHQ